MQQKNLKKSVVLFYGSYFVYIYCPCRLKQKVHITRNEMAYYFPIVCRFNNIIYQNIYFSDPHLSGFIILALSFTLLISILKYMPTS